MAFAYDDNLPEAKDWVRLYLGDTVEGEGVRPDDRNFSDEEIAAVLEEQSGDKSKATAILLNILANEWSRVTDVTVGPRHEALSKVALAYRQRADEQSAKAGVQSTAFSSGLVRVSETGTTGVA